MKLVLIFTVLFLVNLANATVRVQIKKDGVVTNEGVFKTQVIADEWVSSHTKFFPVGHVVSSQDITAELAAEEADKLAKKVDAEDIIAQLNAVDFSNVSTAAQLKTVMQLQNRILKHLIRINLQQ